MGKTLVPLLHKEEYENKGSNIMRLILNTGKQEVLEGSVGKVQNRNRSATDVSLARFNV